jgi:alkylhydroperoxidase/carboxymuconolactone decarboxylase family protein YurZ
MSSNFSANLSELYNVTPKLAELTEDVLFGDVWERTELSKRDRSLITCAVLRPSTARYNCEATCCERSRTALPRPN